MKTSIEKLFEQRDKILSKIENYQNAICKHKNKAETPRANTGNWDPNDDRYWYEFKCLDCKKFWTVDVKKP